MARRQCPATVATACLCAARPQTHSMFMVGEETAAAIYRACDEGGEPSAGVELRRHFPPISDGAKARMCVHAIVGWTQRLAADEERR